jgi:hypothetical protein
MIKCHFFQLQDDIAPEGETPPDEVIKCFVAKDSKMVQLQ